MLCARPARATARWARPRRLAVALLAVAVCGCLAAAAAAVGYLDTRRQHTEPPPVPTRPAAAVKLPRCFRHVAAGYRIAGLERTGTNLAEAVVAKNYAATKLADVAHADPEPDWKHHAFQSHWLQTAGCRGCDPLSPPVVWRPASSLADADARLLAWNATAACEPAYAWLVCVKNPVSWYASYKNYAGKPRGHNTWADCDLLPRWNAYYGWWARVGAASARVCVHVYEHYLADWAGALAHTAGCIGDGQDLRARLSPPRPHVGHVQVSGYRNNAGQARKYALNRRLSCGLLAPRDILCSLTPGERTMMCVLVDLDVAAAYGYVADNITATTSYASPDVIDFTEDECTVSTARPLF